MNESRPHGNDFGPGGPRYAPQGREPVFNLPAYILAFAAILVAIHAIRVFLLTNEQDLRVLVAFAFIPLRYGEHAGEIPVPAAAWWSPITYSFLHGSWTHLLVNLFWLVAFGSPVVRRLGALRTTAIALLASLAGAAAHYLAFAGQWVPVVGASAVVAGFMGAAARFAFTGRSARGLNVHGPAQSLVQSFSNPTFLAFLLVWLLVNFVAGVGALALPDQGAAIAWQAHIGGFAAGLLSFSLFDRRR